MLCIQNPQSLCVVSRGRGERKYYKTLYLFFFFDGIFWVFDMSILVKLKTIIYNEKCIIFSKRNSILYRIHFIYGVYLG